MNRRYSFPRGARIGGRLQFSRIYQHGKRISRGALTAISLPSESDRPRLGISIPRRVGSAVVRNRIKRLLREAFRVCRNDIPRGYDVVVVVKPHKPLTLAEYQKSVSALLVGTHNHWKSCPGPSNG
jgi:ribonuclease P protein component